VTHDLNRLAVLISGPLRTFTDVWPKNLLILENLKIDFECFIHTWDKNYDTHKDIFESSNSSFFWRWKPSKLKKYDCDPKHILSSFHKKWNIKIEPLENAFTDFPKLHLISEKNLIYKNSIAMFYGMKEVAKLAISSGDTFSHYLRIRSDALLPDRFKFNASNDLVMYGGTVPILGSRVSDQCFGGDFIDTIKSMFVIDTLKNNVAHEGWFNSKLALPRYAENSMYEHLKEVKLINKIRIAPKKSLVLVVRNTEVFDDETPYIRFYKACIKRNRIILIKKVFKIASFTANKLKIAKLLRRIFGLNNFSNLD
jgi:hypothetical protein